MKVVIYRDKATADIPILDGYTLAPPWTPIPSQPGFKVNCGRVWFGSASHAQFVVGPSGMYYCAIDGNKIIRFKPPLAQGAQPETIYQHSTWIHRLGVRTVNGTDRLYFSGLAKSVDDQNYHEIFWLDHTGKAHHYWSVGMDDLPLPSPCNPLQIEPMFYSGDFTFGENNTLYVSNGNCLPCGIFLVTGATADAVTGMPHSLFNTTEFSISDLQYDGQGGLLFSSFGEGSDPGGLRNRVMRFDLTKGSVNTICNSSGELMRGFSVCPVKAKIIGPILDRFHLEGQIRHLSS